MIHVYVHRCHYKLVALRTRYTYQVTLHYKLKGCLLHGRQDRWLLIAINLNYELINARTNIV